MQRIFIDNHDRILCYGNPAGYITEKEAVVDTMFQTQELESFLQKQAQRPLRPGGSAPEELPCVAALTGQPHQCPFRFL